MDLRRRGRAGERRLEPGKQFVDVGRRELTAQFTAPSPLIPGSVDRLAGTDAGSDRAVHPGEEGIDALRCIAGENYHLTR